MTILRELNADWNESGRNQKKMAEPMSTKILFECCQLYIIFIYFLKILLLLFSELLAYPVELKAL